MSCGWTKGWSTAELELAERLWTGGGHSAAKIAGLLPLRSRNAVIGECRRKGWKRGSAGGEIEAAGAPFPPFRSPLPIEAKKPEAIEPATGWRCHTPGCPNTRLRPYLHCQACKAQAMREGS